MNVSLFNNVLDRYKNHTGLTPARFAVGVAANVRLNDLQELFLRVKRGEKVEGIDSLDFAAARKFEELDSRQLERLLAPFHKLGEGRQSVLDVYCNGKAPGLDPLVYDPYRTDAEWLQRISDLEKIEAIDPALAYSEWRAKDFAYMEQGVGAMVPVLTEKGERRWGSIAAVLPDQNDGIVAKVTKAWEKEAGADVFYLDFRGTQWQPSRKAALPSMQRDLDVTGVGRCSFRAREQEIIDMLETEIRASKGEKVVLHIGGHSLGGADAQRAVTALFEHLSPELWTKVERVVMTAHNAPAVEGDVNDSFRSALSRLGANAPLVELTYVRFDGDPVQESGEIFVGAEIDLAKLKRRVVEIKHPTKVGLLAHSARGFRGTGRLAVHEDEAALHHYLCKRECSQKKPLSAVAASVAEVGAKMLGNWALKLASDWIPQRVV